MRVRFVSADEGYNDSGFRREQERARYQGMARGNEASCTQRLAGIAGRDLDEYADVKYVCIQ